MLVTHGAVEAPLRDIIARRLEMNRTESLVNRVKRILNCSELAPFLNREELILSTVGRYGSRSREVALVGRELLGSTSSGSIPKSRAQSAPTVQHR